MTTTAARRERAQSVLEFALVVPLFLLLIFGLIDFARLLFTYASLSNGAREMTADTTCARQLDTGSTTCTSGVSTTYGPCGLPLQSGTCPLGQPPQDGLVQVSVTYTFQFNPLFQNRLQGIVDVSFMRPSAVLTTTARAYVE